MLSPSSPNFTLLLQVFSQGLIANLITRDEIIAWADEIIDATNEPDYLFIEISLSSDKNDLIEAINKHFIQTDNPVCARVLIGRIYNKHIVDTDASTDNVLAAINALSNLNIANLTSYEIDTIYAFEDYEMYYALDLFQLHTDVFRFFSLYKSFNLIEHAEWEALNVNVEAALEEERIKMDLKIQSYYEAKQIAERQQIKQSNKYALYKVLALITIVVGSILTIYLTIQFVTEYSQPNAHHEYIAPILTLVWMIWRLKVSFYN
jgi:hypothetical protein